MPCEHTERLLDAYLAALGAFYDAHKPTVRRWISQDGNHVAKETTGGQLREARFNYWLQVEIYDSVAADLTGRGDLLAV